ncbi:hypothetical protein GGGNBK_18665 [Sporosarcina sp. ANT_H38]
MKKSKMQQLRKKLIAKGIQVQLIPNFRHKKTDRHCNVSRRTFETIS